MENSYYQTEGDLIGDPNQMYIISDDQNGLLQENCYGYTLADDGNGNVNLIQIQDPNAMGGQELVNGEESYVLYTDDGNGIYVDMNGNEGSQHIDISNSNVINYKCPSCSQSYQNANAFTKHMKDKHFVKVFVCRQCEQFFETLSQLFLHSRRTHVDPKKPPKNPSNYKFHCTECDYMTNNGGTMEHHKRAHSGVKPYECDICKKKFAQKANMKTHKNRHIHKDRIFRCETCKKSFNSHDIYLAHLRTREHELQEHFQMIDTKTASIKCLGCNLIFESGFQVTKHSRSCEILKSLDLKFQCIDCELNVANAIELKSHLKNHRGVKRIITCPVCGERGFPGFNQLNHHITRAHALKVNRRNVCRYCEMTFENKDTLDSHIEDMHANEKNARQSRGAAGRLRCRYEDCDFTSNSVMLMDRHHDQHLNNTLPEMKPQPKTRRKRTKPEPNVVKEEFLDAIIDQDMDNVHAEVLREPVQTIKEEFSIDDVMSFDQPKPKKLPKQSIKTESNLLDIAAEICIEKPENVKKEVPRKRGRPRKKPTRFEDFEVSDVMSSDCVKLEEVDFREFI